MIRCLVSAFDTDEVLFKIKQILFGKVYLEAIPIRSQDLED